MSAQRDSSAQRYALLGEKSNHDDDDSNTDVELVDHVHYQRHSRLWTVWLPGAQLLVICALMVAYLFKPPSLVECIEKTSLYSPANEAVEYIEYDLDNDFGKRTEYTGPPSPELESTWERLWLYEGVRITDDDLPALNRSTLPSPELGLRKADDGKGGYHGSIGVFHTIHCLNMLRQHSWRDYYYQHPDIVRTPGDLLDSELGIRMHIDHCIEALRLTLMCHADTTPYMIYTDPTVPNIGLRADFSPHAKCRNFERIADWTRKNQLTQPTYTDWRGAQ